MARKSPYAEATLEDAYAAWCALTLPLARGRGEKVRKPRFETWAKTHRAKWEAFQSKMEADIEAATTVAQAKGDSPADLAQTIAEAVQAALAQAMGTTAAPATSEFRARRTEKREDGARNAVLWALNEEGLLDEALRRAENEGLTFITQSIGTALLTETFGPLSR